MITFFDKAISQRGDGYPTCAILKLNHIGQSVAGGYTITEQYPFGCLAVADICEHAKEITTYKGHKMMIGYVDRKFIPLCELEQFA